MRLLSKTMLITSNCRDAGRSYRLNTLFLLLFLGKLRSQKRLCCLRSRHYLLLSEEFSKPNTGPLIMSFRINACKHPLSFPFLLLPSCCGLLKYYQIFRDLEEVGWCHHERHSTSTRHRRSSVMCINYPTHLNSTTLWIVGDRSELMNLIHSKHK